MILAVVLGLLDDPVCIAKADDWSIFGAVRLRGSRYLSDDYEDILSTGFGVSAELGEVWRLEKGPWWLGAYVSAGMDRYPVEGSIESLMELEGDDWVNLSALAGVKLMYGPDVAPRSGEWGFTWEAHVAFGVVRYSALKADATLLFFPLGELEIFDPSTAFASEIGTRFGFGSPSFALQLGFGFRYQGAPKGGDNTTEDPDNPWTWGIDFSAEFRF